MFEFCVLLLMSSLVHVSLNSALKEFSLARYGVTFANNSVININLVGVGYRYPGVARTDSGALECHTDDTTCCRGMDNPPNGVGRGEWYYNGTVVPPPGGGSGYYRARDHMVIRLNRAGFTLSQTGVYTCVIPGAGGVSITRYITLERGLCDNLPDIANGTVTYTPPRSVSATLPNGKRYTGTIATYSCSSGYQLIGSSLRACGADGTWNGTTPYCILTVCGPLLAPTNGQAYTASGTTFGSTAVYSCNHGYTLIGSATTSCASNGIWSSPVPVCRAPIINATITTPTESPTFGQSYSLTCTVTGVPSSINAVISYQWFRAGENQMDTKVGGGYFTLILNPLSLSDVGLYTCVATIRSTFLFENITVTSKLLYLKFAALFIQVRLASVRDCIDYIATNSRLKTKNIINELTQNIVSRCSCQFNSSFITRGHLRCFEESPGIVTFRSQLSETSQVSATDLVGYVEQWIDNNEGFIVDSVFFKFKKGCPLVVPKIDSVECPDMMTFNLGGVVGGVVGALLLVTFVLVAVGIVIVTMVLRKKKQRKSREGQSSHTKQKKVELQETAVSGPTYETVDTPVPVEYEEIKFKETQGNPAMMEQPHPPKGGYEYTQCAAYAPTQVTIPQQN